MKILKEGKTAEQIYNELKAKGVPVAIKNGVYCKIVYNTYEAINSIPPIIEYTEEELKRLQEEI